MHIPPWYSSSFHQTHQHSLVVDSLSFLSTNRLIGAIPFNVILLIEYPQS